MLKFEHIPVGHEIRAYDFEPVGDWRDEIYVQGTIKRHDEKEGAKFLVIDCEEDSGPEARKEFGSNRPSRVGVEIFIPMETAFFEWDNRVIDITEAAGEFPIAD